MKGGNDIRDMQGCNVPQPMSEEEYTKEINELARCVLV
jgi:hypothetical protein